MNQALVMTMLAYRERNAVAAVKTQTGMPAGPVWRSYGDPVPCRAWITNSRRDASSDGVSVTQRVLMLTPLDIDMTNADRISRITDRSGKVLFEGPMVVDYSARRRGHLEWSLGQGRIN